MNYKAMADWEGNAMKKAPLFNPRIFDYERWAIGYAKRHAKMGEKI